MPTIGEGEWPGFDGWGMGYIVLDCERRGGKTMEAGGGGGWEKMELSFGTVPGTNTVGPATAEWGGGCGAEVTWMRAKDASPPWP